MGLEQTINQRLNKHPGIKKGIKRVYQLAMYTISPKIKSEGDIERISPDDLSHEYFFGYYDKSPEDVTGRYVLCLKADDTWSDVAPKTPAQILLIDTSLPDTDPARVRVLAETHTWNVQQGCMMQWLGPDYNREIIYNDFRDGKYCSVVLDVFSGTERVLAMPVYSVSADGSFALTLDFSRLHRLRPGYGYSNMPEETKDQKIPKSTAIWKLDIVTNTVTPVLPYTAFSNFEPRPEMRNAEHKVNHIMLSPNGNRFMVLHRWFDGQRKYTRLVTVNTDGTEMYNLSDDDMVSHCYWKNDDEILAFENKKGSGIGYYLMEDRTKQYSHLWLNLSADGHPSYSPDGNMVVTDTYPNRSRVAVIRTISENDIAVVARVFAPFKYDNDTRCDLHPRWSRDGNKVYFDSIFEGHRGLYIVPPSHSTSKNSVNVDKRSNLVSQVRGVINRSTKKLFQNERLRKKSVVIYYNINTFLREKSPYSGEGLFDPEALVKNRRHFLTENYRANSYYGIGKVLRDFAMYSEKIDACCEHGVYFGDYLNERECINSGYPAIITFGDQRRDYLRKHTDRMVFTIGPYIAYADCMLSSLEMERKKAEFGKTLLVFPVHSVERIETDFDMSSWLREIKNFKDEHNFQTVIVCLYYRDIELGRNKAYEEQGYIVVSAGRREDQKFLNRLRTFIDLSDYTMSNNVGTHIGYSVVLGKPHYILDQDMEYKMDSEAEKKRVPTLYLEDAVREKAEVAAAFCNYTDTITEAQKKVCEKYWGIQHTRSSEEMNEIFTICSDVLKLSKGKEAQFHNAAIACKENTNKKRTHLIDEALS